MNTPRRLTLSAFAGALIALAAVPAVASATIFVAPGSMTFPARQVATQSDPQTATVFVRCTVEAPPGNCALNDVFTYNPQLSGANPGDFSVANVSCPAVLTNNGTAQTVCQFNVLFTPTAPGTRQAVLTPGTGSTSQPNSIVLSGTGVAAPPPPQPTGQRAAALAKCKKKKTKKKRRNCRTKANQLPL